MSLQLALPSSDDTAAALAEISKLQGRLAQESNVLSAERKNIQDSEAKTLWVHKRWDNDMGIINLVACIVNYFLRGVEVVRSSNARLFFGRLR